MGKSRSRGDVLASGKVLAKTYDRDLIFMKVKSLSLGQFIFI